MTMTTIQFAGGAPAAPVASPLIRRVDGMEIPCRGHLAAGASVTRGHRPSM